MENEIGIRSLGYNSRPFTVALFGNGAALGPLCRLLNARPRPLEDMQIAGWVNSPVSFRTDSMLDNVNRFNDWPALLEQFPSVDIACDLTDDGVGMAELSKCTTIDTILVSSRNIIRFCQATLAKPAPTEEMTALRQAEELFISLLNKLDKEVLVVDRVGTILAMNERLCESLMGKREEFIGKNCLDVLHNELAVAANRQVFQNLLQAREKISEAYDVITPDSKVIHYYIQAIPLYHTNAALERVIITRRDITAEVQLSQQLILSEKKAAMGEIAMYLAHEIRNPLFVIGGFADRLARQRQLEESVHEKAVIIFNEAKRLDTLLKTVISFTEFPKYDRAETDVNQVVMQTDKMMSLSAKLLGARLKLELASTIPRVHIQDDMLKQCLINIISNSLQAFSGSDSGIIKIKTRYAAGLVHLEVEDNGHGVLPEIQEQIFNPFFTTKEGFTGLGLTMAKKIIGQFGGTIHLFSNPGAGTLVSMVLKPKLAI